MEVESSSKNIVAERDWEKIPVTLEQSRKHTIKMSIEKTVDGITSQGSYLPGPLIQSLTPSKQMVENNMNRDSSAQTDDQDNFRPGTTSDRKHIKSHNTNKFPSLIT